MKNTVTRVSAPDTTEGTKRRNAKIAARKREEDRKRNTKYIGAHDGRSVPTATREHVRELMSGRGGSGDPDAMLGERMNPLVLAAGGTSPVAAAAMAAPAVLQARKDIKELGIDITDNPDAMFNLAMLGMMTYGAPASRLGNLKLAKKMLSEKPWASMTKAEKLAFKKATGYEMGAQGLGVETPDLKLNKNGIDIIEQARKSSGGEPVVVRLGEITDIPKKVSEVFPKFGETAVHLYPKEITRGAEGSNGSWGKRLLDFEYDFSTPGKMKRIYTKDQGTGLIKTRKPTDRELERIADGRSVPPETIQVKIGDRPIAEIEGTIVHEADHAIHDYSGMNFEEGFDRSLYEQTIPKSTRDKHEATLLTEYWSTPTELDAFTTQARHKLGVDTAKTLREDSYGSHPGIVELKTGAPGNGHSLYLEVPKEGSDHGIPDSTIKAWGYRSREEALVDDLTQFKKLVDKVKKNGPPEHKGIRETEVELGAQQDAKGGQTADVRAATKGGDGGDETQIEAPVQGSAAPVSARGPRIVINPSTFHNEKDALCVAYNEALRIVMEENGFDPVSEPTDAQREFFADTAYADDELMLRRTILARICVFDTSVKDPTDEQLEEAVEFLETVMEIGAPQNAQEQSVVQRAHDIIARTLQARPQGQAARGAEVPQGQTEEPQEEGNPSGTYAREGGSPEPR